MMSFIFIVVSAYLLGSISWGQFFAKRQGINLKELGSNNIGATNALRILGKKIGALVLFMDTAKGVIPVYLSHLLGLPMWQMIVVGLAAIIGHIYPLFLHFKGGKGVATALGVFIVLSPISIVLALSVFLIITLITKYVSLGSILGTLTVFLYQILKHSPWQGDNLALTLLSIILLIMIIYNHRNNIKRLIIGKENKLK